MASNKYVRYKKVMASLQKAEIDMYREVFKFFDKNNKGYLVAEDFAKALRYINQVPAEGEAEELLKLHDINGDGKVTFEEMVVVTVKRKKFTDDESEIRKAFRKYDKNGDGFLNRDELIAVLNSMGVKLGVNSVDEMMNRFDENHDDVIQYEEFVKMIQGGLEGEEEGKEDHDDTKPEVNNAEPAPESHTEKQENDNTANVKGEEKSGEKSETKGNSGKPEGKVKFKGTSKNAGKNSPKVDTKSSVKNDKLHSKSDSKTDVKSDTKSDVQSHVKSDVKSDTLPKQVNKNDAKTTARSSGGKSSVKSETKGGTEHDGKSAEKSDATSDGKFGKSGIKIDDMKVNSKSNVKTNSKSHTRTDSKSSIKSDTRSNGKSDEGCTDQPKSISKTKPTH